MSLNIKNERVHELAREAARRTGLTQTSAIERALEQMLHDLDRDVRRQRVDKLLKQIHGQLTDEDRAALSEGTDFLYNDETGLP